MNQIDGPRDESIKEPEQLLMQCARVPAFDAMCPDQERLAMEFCQEISGLKGKPGRMPDPVRLLEMAEALYLAECGADCSNPSSISQGCSARRALQARSQIKYLERHIAEPAPVISQSEALVRYCPGCGSIGTVEEKYLDCCPDGIEARMIPQALAQKCRDTFKMAVDGLLALPQEAAPVAVAVPTKVIEALEMLESGALNVAMNAKNRGDGYDEGYANAMAKMARETLDLLAATPAADAPTTAAALSRACDLLSSTIGILMGQRAKIAYTDNSPVAALVNEAVEFLRPWPEQLPSSAGAPVVLPEPDVFAKVSHKGAAKWDVEFTWPVGKFEEDGDHKLYTEQQVRAMLAAAPKPPAHEPGQHGSAYPAHGITAAPNGGDHGR